MSSIEAAVNRRDVMKLVSAAMLPMMPGAAKGGSDRETSRLGYRVFTVTRPGLNRDIPPGKESLQWVANSSTLIYGEREAVLVDSFLTVEQTNGLADGTSRTTGTHQRPSLPSRAPVK